MENLNFGFCTFTAPTHENEAHLGFYRTYPGTNGIELVDLENGDELFTPYDDFHIQDGISKDVRDLITKLVERIVFSPEELKEALWGRL